MEPTPIPHSEVRSAFRQPDIRVVKYCPTCGSAAGYSDAGKRDGRQMYRCRICRRTFPQEKRR